MRTDPVDAPTRGRGIAAGIAVLLVPVLLAACGSPGSTAAPTGPPVPVPSATLLPTGSASPSASAVSIDPCTLADAAEVQRAAGGTVGSPQLDLRSPAVPGCTWPLTDSRLGDGNLLVVITATGGTAATFSSVQAAFPGATSVSGLGAAAFFVGGIGQLVVQQHAVTVTVAASGFVLDGNDPPVATIEQVLAALAATVVAHL